MISGDIHGRYTPTSHLEGTSDQAYPPPEGTWNQAYPPPPVDRMTDTSENITFPVNSLVGSKDKIQEAQEREKQSTLSILFITP